MFKCTIYKKADKNIRLNINSDSNRDSVFFFFLLRVFYFCDYIQFRVLPEL
jgi:hypothetical protein